MARKPSNSGLITRRAALAGAAAAAAYGAARGNAAIAEPASDPAAAKIGAGPVFSATGPDAELYGAAEGFPIPGFLRARLGLVEQFGYSDELSKSSQSAMAALR